MSQSYKKVDGEVYTPLTLFYFKTRAITDCNEYTS